MTLANFIKYNRMAYAVYRHAVGAVVNGLKVFVKKNDRLILINSFAGRNFDDSPKAIYDCLRSDGRFSGCEFVWAFHEPDKFNVPAPTNGARLRVVKTNSLGYFRAALSARAWVTNSSVERGLRFKRKGTFYLNTWHGTPIKLMGSDIPEGNASFRAKGGSAIDVMMSQGGYETGVFSRAFGIPKANFLEVGLPRNDVLAKCPEQTKEQVREGLSIPQGKRVILYAPTFREYEKGDDFGVVMAPPVDFGKWERALADGYVLLVRAHYEVAHVMGVERSDFLRDVTRYPSLNDLIIASDILVSDYSSVYFDWSITGKPMVHFTYDYDEYNEKRGMYFDIRDYIDGGETEDEVIGAIARLGALRESEATVAFREKFVKFYGHAAPAAVDRIAEALGVDSAARADREAPL